MECGVVRGGFSERSAKTKTKTQLPKSTHSSPITHFNNTNNHSNVHLSSGTVLEPVDPKNTGGHAVNLEKSRRRLRFQHLLLFTRVIATPTTITPILTTQAARKKQASLNSSTYIQSTTPPSSPSTPVPPPNQQYSLYSSSPSSARPPRPQQR